jgi:tetratricopeptide (TPR) repeat protein
MSRDEVWISLTKSASSAFNLGQYRQAKTRFRVAARDAVGRQDVAQIAMSLHNLALIYSKQGNIRKAFRLAKKALTVLENSHEPAGRLMSEMLDRLAELSLSNQRYREVSAQDIRRAIAYLERAHHVDCAIDGPYQAHIPHRLTRVAQLYCQLKDYVSACRTYKEACDTVIIGHDRQLLRGRMNAVQVSDWSVPGPAALASTQNDTLSQHQILDFSPQQRNGSFNPVSAETQSAFASEPV